MKSFVLRRLVNLLPVLVGISLAAFIMMYVLPGDPAALLSPQNADPQAIAQVRARYRLDAPLPERYLSFLTRALQGDLGRSIRSERPVTAILMERFIPTAQLALGSLAFAVLLGVGAGIASAAKPRSLLDAGCMLAALAGVSVPVFWLGMMLIILLAGPGAWFAVSGYEPLSLRHLALPCIALGSVTAAVLARLTRSAMLEVLGRDYIRTARAKGVVEWRVLIRHGLRNALIPIVTIIGASLAGLLSGAVLTETVFNIPGIGREILDAIDGRDYPVVVGAVVLLAMIFVIVNLIVDVIYAALDPRIRLE
jgi:ABC-type dipeptide/oligopeptide/nickel transport system permease component